MNMSICILTQVSVGRPSLEVRGKKTVREGKKLLRERIRVKLAGAD